MAVAAYNVQPITREGHERLSAELERLVEVERPRLAAELREARGDGNDPGENSSLGAALASQAALERRIDELESVLTAARIVDPPPDGVAGIGHTVTIQLEDAAKPTAYHLVGTIEADPATRRLSIESPIGSALVGRRAGETVEVETPGGVRRVRVLDVTTDPELVVEDVR